MKWHNTVCITMIKIKEWRDSLYYIIYIIIYNYIHVQFPGTVKVRSAVLSFHNNNIIGKQTAYVVYVLAQEYSNVQQLVSCIMLVLKLFTIVY